MRIRRSRPARVPDRFEDVAAVVGSSPQQRRELRVVGQVRQHPELDLRVIRRQQHFPPRRRESAAQVEAAESIRRAARAARAAAAQDRPLIWLIGSQL